MSPDENSADYGVATDAEGAGGGETEDAGGVPDGLVGLDLAADPSDTGVPPKPGAFGAACWTSDDCESGYCVEGPFGFVCTTNCVSDCPDGYDCRASSGGGADLAFICIPRFKKFCSPCAVDANCAGGSCLQIDGESRCAPACATDSDCNAGFACDTAESSAAEAGHCLPTTNSCTCYQGHSDNQRSCTTVGAVGTCYGIQTCDMAEGWSDCDARQPGAEECNGLDDDCNGLIDEGLTAGDPCTNEVVGVGSCTGSRACLGGLGWICQAPTPALEACDFNDNDCDGESDEDFKSLSGEYTLDAHCGTCGNDCVGKFPHGTGRCGESGGAAICVVDTCDTDYVKANDFQCTLPPDVSCQACASDGDCYGGTCVVLDGQSVCASPCGAEAKSCGVGFQCDTLDTGEERCLPVTKSCVCSAKNDGLTRACGDTNAAGTCYGSQTCSQATGWSVCTASSPAAEACNGKDDDCNGAVDDGVVPPPTPCQNTNVHGLCTGEWRCGDTAAGVAWSCSAATPAEDVCDYTDNDCSGAVDDGFRDSASGQYVHDDHCGACGIVCTGTLPNATAACVLSGGKPQCRVLECSAGYYQASPLACLPLADNLCVPCSSDAGCGSPGDICLDLDGAKYCGRDCGPDNLHGAAEGVCPTGFACTSVSGGKQCKPITGACTCLSATDAGLTRSCVNSGPSGSCYGVQTCDPKVGWSGCSAGTPGIEICDGKDDDCDAVIDDVPGRGDPCTVSNAFGACPGVKSCVPGTAPLVCQGTAAVAESCNHKDDDCDGQVDEDFTVGTVCQAGKGQCLTYGVFDCAADGKLVACTALAGAVKVEVCDGLDNDCDGSTDEGATWDKKGQLCTAGVGACQNTGTLGCDGKAPSGALVCTVTAGTGTSERCNGLDDDCDSETDEDALWLNKGSTCLVGKGVCLRAGVYVCDAANGATATVCTVQQGPTAVESCDDLDNDCDGQTDEDFTTKGTVCTAGVGSCQQFGVRVCDAANPKTTRCNAVSGAIQSEVCDGADNDCDSQTDEGWLAGGKYTANTACGNCYTDCTGIFAVPNAHGICDASGAPKCLMKCCKTGDTDPACQGGNWVDVNQVPSDGCEFLQDPDAIYVSGTDPNALDKSGCGLAPYDALAGTYPCATIPGGLIAAVATGRSKVLVAAAAYNTTVTLVDGKSLLGGYNPTTWTRDASTNLTAIFGQSATGHRKAVIAKDILTKPTTFEGFVVYGESATGPGENSYGIWVSNSNANLVLKGNVVWAGYGGPAASAADGASGTSGVSGQGGKDAYEPSGKYECAKTCKVAAATVENAGGAPGTLTCNGVAVSGGAGGRADCPDWDESWEACAACPGAGPPPSGNQTVTTSGGDAPGGGKGGAGGCDALTSACFLPACVCIAPQDKNDCPNGTGSLDGQNGAVGTNGAGGIGAAASAGAVNAGEWGGSVGSAGLIGTPGRGGGGGGAGGGVEGGKAAGCSNGFSDIGGSGGSGGSGGCAGAAGAAGGSGGGSFGLFVTFPTAPATLPTLQGNVIHRGVGGPGGRGGNGGTGGAGGHGGLGGKGGQAGTDYWCAGAGSKGGEGGAGGHGGGGGGGPGGPSFGLYAHGATPAQWKTGNTFAAGGAGGPGGPGGGSGAGGLGGSTGASGLSASTSY